MIEMPKTVSVQDPNGKLVDVSTAAWSADFWDYMLCYAWGVRMQRSTASAKDAQKAKQAVYDGMVKGEIPERGPSGPRGSDEDRADKHWFEKMYKTKFGKDWTLAQAWQARTAAMLVNEGEAATAKDGMAMVAANPGLVDTVKEYYRGTEEWKTSLAFVQMDNKAKDSAEPAQKLGLFKKA